MSTKPIREALEKMSEVVDSRVRHAGERKQVNDAYTAALEAVRAIEEMARDILAGISGNGMTDESLDLLESIAKEAP